MAFPPTVLPSTILKQKVFLSIVAFSLFFVVRAGADEPKAGTLRSWGGFVIPYFPPDLKFIAISASQTHVLGITPDRTVVAWGKNRFGQSTVPAHVTNVIAVSAGTEHNLVLRADGSVIAWGAETNVPPSVTNIIAVVAGAAHSLALKADGTVLAWGSNRFGESTVPTNLANVIAVDAKLNRNMALRADGTIVTWGAAANPPTNLTSVVAISVGGRHQLALKSDGTVVAWNGYSEMEVPPTLSRVIAISAGENHSLALKDDGSVIAWGGGPVEWYELETGKTNVPVGLSGVVAIEAETYRSLALKADGTVVTWGGLAAPGPGESDGFVQVSSKAHDLALRADGRVLAWGSNKILQCFVPPGLSNVIAIDTGGHPTIEHDESQSVSLTADGRAVAWGKIYRGGADMFGGDCPGSPLGSLRFKDIAAGAFWAAGLTTNGTLHLWGCNTWGLEVPQDLQNVLQIDAGREHCIALLADGTVRTFGKGESTTTDVPANLSNVIAVSAGWDYNLALRSDGTVVAWGRFFFGGLPAVVPPTVTNIVAISVGDFSATALKADGTLVQWDRDGNDISYTIPTDLGKVIAISEYDTVIVETGSFQRPLLTVQRSDGELLLHWSDSASKYKLQQSAAGTISGWTVVDAIPTISSVNCTVTIKLDENSRFYRLIEKHPLSSPAMD